MATYTEKDKVVPIIVEYGARGIKSYTEEEHLESIKQAFIDKKADFITLDSNINGQQFLSANVAWAMNKGWLLQLVGGLSGRSRRAGNHMGIPADRERHQRTH